MPHVRTSCRGKASAWLQVELEHLYAQRSAVVAAIQELERKQLGAATQAESYSPNNSLESSSKPCNLTSCRSA